MVHPPIYLSDLGERRLIEQVFASRYAQDNPQFGDDCAIVLSSPPGAIVSTTDPAPKALALNLGFPDYYYQGWLLATANLSDLAAAGAIPYGLLTSLVLPGDMTVRDLKRLLDGIDDCCKMCQTKVIGGNIRDGKAMELTATAVGICNNFPLSRKGAKSGDIICVIGDLGLFWAGALAAHKKLAVPARFIDELFRNLLTPMPKVAIGQKLCDSMLVSSCMDNSDGLYSSLLTLSLINQVGMELNMDPVSYPESVSFVAAALDMSPIRLALGWGDWQLIVTAPMQNVETIRQICEHNNCIFNAIGEVTPKRGVFVNYQAEHGRLMELDSERFTKSSWFLYGLESYIEAMLNLPIVNVID